MIDDFFQQKPSSSSFLSKVQRDAIFRGLLYISIGGFILGWFFGYLHIKGWIPTAEEGLILYGISFGTMTLFSILFAMHRRSLRLLKTEKIKKSP